MQAGASAKEVGVVACRHLRHHQALAHGGDPHVHLVHARKGEQQAVELVLRKVVQQEALVEELVRRAHEAQRVGVCGAGLAHNAGVVARCHKAQLELLGHLEESRHQ